MTHRQRNSRSLRANRRGFDSTGHHGLRRAPSLVTRTAARRVLVVLHAAALLVVGIEYVHPFNAAGHGIERVHALDFLASYAVYGFTACVALVLMGRLLRRGVMRDENYYDGGP